MKNRIKKISFILLMVSLFTGVSPFSASTNVKSNYFIVYGFDYLGYYDASLTRSAVIISGVIIPNCEYSYDDVIKQNIRDSFRKFYNTYYQNRRQYSIRDITVEGFFSLDEANKAYLNIVKMRESQFGHNALKLDNFRFNCN
jgi:hypothetical protein